MEGMKLLLRKLLSKWYYSLLDVLVLAETDEKCQAALSKSEPSLGTPLKLRVEGSRWDSTCLPFILLAKDVVRKHEEGAVASCVAAWMELAINRDSESQRRLRAALHSHLANFLGSTC